MKFLKQIAQIYASKLTTTDQLLFVFPNRRAGLFFKKELLSLINTTLFSPKITDINSLAASLSPIRKANDVELLFELYDSYVQVRSKYTPDIESIDSFIHFGTTLLGDFNEIDKYLIDTKMLFSNIADLNDLNDYSEFLSEQQIKVLNTFWNNVRDDKPDSLSFNKQFVSLWSNLHEIYLHFTNSLISKGIGYDGLIYRTAINSISTDQALNTNSFSFSNICFIGFNSLTTSEYRIFNYFKQLGIADFYFDYPEYYNLTSSPFANSVAKYYQRNLSEFPSRFAYTQPHEAHTPNIHLHSTPSNSNQINVACSILDNNQNLSADNTAILLSDESLMPSLVQQLPKHISKINITMGYPLALSPVASLINHILTLQTELTTSPQGDTQFYYKPILNILAHSSIQNIYLSSSNQIASHITKTNLIRVTKNEINEIINSIKASPDEKQFFASIFQHHTDTISLIDYLCNIINKLLNTIAPCTNDTDSEFLYQYNKILRQLKSIIAQNTTHPIPVSILRLIINRLSPSLKAQFEGEPVEGMQIMGLLESRLLDFDNIILLNFNDSKIPGNKSVDSVIPYNLRQVYNLPTYEVSDAIQAYNFYRTLYHTKNIHLIYDSRSEGAQNEISRYFYQIKYLLKADIHHHNYTLPIASSSHTSQPLTINKSDNILQKLDTYKHDKFLSASRLKHYITCPLKFYFSTIADIKTPDKINELEESGLLGRIYHLAMELYYNTQPTPQKISTDDVQRLVSQAFDTESEKSHKRIQATGFNALIFNIVCKFVTDTINFDIKRNSNLQFHDVKSEVKVQAKINDVNFLAFIDRIDHDSQTTNIIDYKTSSKLQNKSIKITELISSDNESNHEIFQIIFYCYLYKLTYGATPLLPALYKMNALKKHNSTLSSITLSVPTQLLDPDNLPSFGIDLNSIDNTNSVEITITDYAQISTPFEWLIQKMLHDIYDPQKPFVPNTTKNTCSCPYINLCQQKKSNDNY